MKRVIQFGAFTTILAISAGALAQEPPPAAPAPAPAPAPVQAQASYQAGGGGGMTLPGAAPAQAVAGDSDHDAVIGSFGVGWLGFDGLNVPDTNGAAHLVGAPIVGLRYWVDQMIGIDAGLGVGIHSTSASAGGQDQPTPSYTAFLLHGGVPINLASAGHFNFQIVPELNVGFGGMSQDANATLGTPKYSGSGFHFDIGGRVGTEIHFGFMGLPKLSLQASVGLKFSTDSTKLEVTPQGGTSTTTKGSATDFQTTVQNSPWDIFRTNVAALYYF